jgi:hypothetical protein
VANEQLSRVLTELQEILSEIAAIDRPNKAMWGARPTGFSSTFDLTVDPVSSRSLSQDEMEYEDNGNGSLDAFAETDRELVFLIQIKSRSDTDTTAAFVLAERVKTRLSAESVRSRCRGAGFVYVDSDDVKQAKGPTQDGRAVSSAFFFATFTARSRELLESERMNYVDSTSFEQLDEEGDTINTISVSGDP